MTTYFVDNVAGLDTQAGTRANQFQTLSKAITVAVDGDTIVLKFTGTDYDPNGTITKCITIRGNGGLVGLTSASGAGTHRLAVAGAVVNAYNLKASGATNAGVCGFRAQEGGTLNLFGCTSTGNDRAWTIIDTGTINATDCAFTGNTSVQTYSASGAGEFTRCTGMPAGPDDTRGVRDRSGTIHLHTFLRGGVFYAANEFYAQGNRSVTINPETGVDTQEGTNALPVKSNYTAMRLLGARRAIIAQAAAGATVIRESNNTPAVLNIQWDYDLASKQDSNFNPVELRFSKAHTDWALDAGTTYTRSFSFQPNLLWRNDQFADTVIKRGDGTTFPPSSLPPAYRPWVTLAYAADLTACRATVNTWFYTGGAMYVNLGVNPNGLVECPAEDNHGVNIDNANVRLANLVIRGANRTAIQLVNGGRLEGQNLYLLNNGVNGIDMTHGCKARIIGGRMSGNGWDGAGAHMNSDLEISDVITDLNGDDGFSPHDQSRIKATRVVSYGNSDRGAVAINQARLELTDVLLDDNARGGSAQTPTANGQNLSLEDQAQLTFSNVTLGALGAGGSSQTQARAIGSGRLAGYGFKKLDGTVPAVTQSGTPSVAVDLSDRDHVRREAINAAS